MKFELFSLISLLQLGSVVSQCDKLLPRPNIYKMSDVDRNKFISAIKKVNSGPRPTKWDLLNRKHVQYFDKIHQHPRFFAWHRLYLWELETELRNIDSSIRIPYWDWTVHYNNMDLDPIWKWFGKGGNPDKGYCVTQGQFVGFQSYYTSDINEQGYIHCSRRDSLIPKVFTGTKQDVEKLIIDNPDPEKFWTQMEYGPHANVHNGLFYDFSGHASPNDPIFWLHHSFVDKVWFDRQMKHRDWYYTYPEGETDMPSYAQTTQDTFVPSNLCYYYEEDNYKWNIPQAKQSDFAQREPEVFVPLSSANATISDEQYLEHAKQYVFKDILLPSNADPSKVKPDCELLDLPSPVRMQLIRMMNYDEGEVRKAERRSAFVVDEENRSCLI